MEKRLTTLLACLFLFIGGVFAQTKVNGTVVSQEDGEPIIGATIMVVGTQVGTVTDANGQFSLTCPEGKKTLRITYVGMEPLEVSARPNMRIVLSSDQKTLDEVIVVAFGTAKKSAFTGSAKVVGSEELSLSQVSDVTSALAGAVPGVQLTSANGAPGASSTIRIRGFSSLGAGMDPLIIVDGAPYSGDLNNLNPNDVESMTVLKDAASNALYGARGANGVIMITTKRAKQGSDARVVFDAKWGANSRALQHYDTFRTPEAYYETHYKALENYFKNGGQDAYDAWVSANSVLTGSASTGGLGYNIWTVPDGQYIIGRDGKLNPAATLGRKYTFRGEDYWITPDDWEKEATRTGLRQEYNASVSAATDRSSFYLSMGYLNNEGITDASDMERYTARLRADYQAKKWMKVGGNISYTRFNYNSLSNNGSSTSTANIWAFTSQMAPIYPVWVRDGQGNIKIDDNYLKVMDYGDTMNAGLTRPFISQANPIMDSRLNTNNSEGNAASGNAFVDFTFLPGLTLTLNGTFNLDETRVTYVYNPYYGQFDTTGGTVEKEHSRLYNYNFQQLLNYNTTLAQHHNIGAMLGHEYYDSRSAYIGASKSQMFDQGNKELSGAVVDGKSSYSYRGRYNNEGYFGRVLYDYDMKYFLSASYRRDASSRFDPDYRWGSFWSIGASWLINKESFFDVDWVDELKLKASYGSQGNDNIGSYRYTNTYSLSNSGGRPGLSFSSKGTRDITWETNGNFNAGIEFSLFKGRVTGDIEYYYRKTTDMLFSFSVAPSLGYASYYDNVGDLYNTGIEADFNINILRQKDLQWDFHLNLATLKNRITKLHPDKKTNVFYDASGKVWEGYTSGSFFISEDTPMYTWRMKEWAGVDPETGEAQWWKSVWEQTQSKNEAGEPLWETTKDDDGNTIYKTDEAGNKIPVMEDVWYDKNGNIVNPDTYEGTDILRRKQVDREKTKTYSDADYFVTKQSTLPKLYGGFGTSVKFYGFDFTINCSYQIGGKQYDSTYANFMANPEANSTGSNIHRDILNAWSETNKGSDIPRWQYADLNVSSQSTRFLTDASYLNIENINFGYTLPRSFTRKFQVEGLRLYFAAENVYYISKRKGFDPRQSYSGAPNATTYSPMRTLSGGLTVTF